MIGRLAIVPAGADRGDLVETIATVPKILELGGPEYAKLGVED